MPYANRSVSTGLFLNLEGYPQCTNFKGEYFFKNIYLLPAASNVTLMLP